MNKIVELGYNLLKLIILFLLIKNYILELKLIINFEIFKKLNN